MDERLTPYNLLLRGQGLTKLDGEPIGARAIGTFKIDQLVVNQMVEEGFPSHITLEMPGFDQLVVFSFEKAAIIRGIDQLVDHPMGC